MIELIKKSLLAGIGAAVLTKEKIEDVLEDFVREGRVTAADARRMAARVAEHGRREFRAAVAGRPARRPKARPRVRRRASRKA